jgi:F-type H+-transporting ATPase subunit b
MPQLDFSTFLPQIFWLFISLSFLYIVLSRYALPRVSDVIEERKDIIAQDIDSAKKFSSETDLAIEELNMKLSEAKINSQSLMNDSLQEIKESNEEKKAILLKEINDDIVAAEAKIQEKKEESLSEISSVSEDIAIEMLENLSIGEIDKEKVISLSRKVN